MKLWQILAVVGLGSLYGLIEPGRLAYALGHATLYVFLPALLFEAAWNLNFRAMRRQWIAIATLAGPGVLLTAAIVAGALSIVRVPFGPAFLAGAILSATDPIAVVAVFRRLKVPRTLATIVECESLFNDAVAVALYRGMLVAIAIGAVSAGSVAVITAQTSAGVAGGIALGIALAFILARLLHGSGGQGSNRRDVSCAYGAYLLADYLASLGHFCDHRLRDRLALLRPRVDHAEDRRGREPLLGCRRVDRQHARLLHGRRGTADRAGRVANRSLPSPASPGSPSPGSSSAGCSCRSPTRALGSTSCASPECAAHLRLRLRSRFRLRLPIAKRSSTARLPWRSRRSPRAA